MMKVTKSKLTAIGITCGVGSMLVGAREAGFQVLGNVEWRSYYHRQDERGDNTFTSNFPGAVFPFKREQMTEEEFRKFSNPHIALGHPESHPDAPIFTRTGWRMVSTLSAGDWVLTHRGRFRQILAVHRRSPDAATQKITLSRNSQKSAQSITLAGNHPVLMGDGSWRRAAEVRKGESITYLCEECSRCGELAPVNLTTGEAGCFCYLRAHWRVPLEEKHRRLRPAHEATRARVSRGEHDFTDADVRRKGQIVQSDRSEAEFLVASALEDVELERQHPVGRYFVNLAIPRLKIAIEVDGTRHNMPNKRQQDVEKQSYLEAAGWTVLRILLRVERRGQAAEVRRLRDFSDEVRRVARNHSGEYQFASFPVRGLWREKFEPDEVLYDLSVDEDNSYVAKATVVHNCGHYSKLNMVNKNFRDHKEDAGDIPLFVDLVAEFRPRFFVMDDLPDSFIAFPMAEYHRRLGDYDLFPEWVSNYYYGNVQKNRRRMFMIGALRDERFTFRPGEREHSMVLRDVLEDLGEPRARGSNVANHDVHTLSTFSQKALHLESYGRGARVTYDQLREWFLSHREGTTLKYVSADGTVKHRPSHSAGYWEGHSHVLDGGSLAIHPRRGTPYTIRERARIQGFPDDFTFYGTKFESDGTYSHEANNDLVKQTGKAMPVQFCRYAASQAAAHILGEPFECSGQRLIPPNPMIDRAKTWYCANVGYSDQEAACGACWLATTCSIRSERLGLPPPVQATTPAPARVVPAPRPARARTEPTPVRTGLKTRSGRTYVHLRCGSCGHTTRSFVAMRRHREGVSECAEAGEIRL